jgi:carotenoid cleavage dioxygenase-like enzyme
VDVNEVLEGVNLVNTNGTTIKTEAKAVREGNKIILTPDTMTEKGLELPVINKRFLSKKTSYFYATGSTTKGYFENSLCKVHTTKKQTFLFKDSDTYYFGEPTFVANPEGKTEDDGILITAVTDIREGSNDFLVFVDARNMEEIARAEFENVIPQALHGIFLPASSSHSH